LSPSLCRGKKTLEKKPREENRKHPQKERKSTKWTRAALSGGMENVLSKAENNKKKDLRGSRNATRGDSGCKAGLLRS